MVVTASGDGSLQIWDAESDSLHGHMPKSIYREHTKEVCSVDWSPSPHNRIFLSGSWDQSIKLWDPLYATSMRTYNDHSDFVFNAKFSPTMANVFASVGADGFLKLWDVLDHRPKASLQSHQYAEVRRSNTFSQVKFKLSKEKKKKKKLSNFRFCLAIGINSIKIFWQRVLPMA